MRAWREAADGRVRSRVAIAAYVASWLLGAAILTGVAIAVLDDGDTDEVSLPPVRETQLADAARRAHCDLRRAGAGDRLDPAVDGSAAQEAARGGFYDEPPDTPSLVAALRQGLVVIHFRSGLDGERVDELRRVQEAAPNGTIITPNPTMPFEVAATAYRRLLGCPQASDESMEAALLFRGRFLGSGPGD
jgi:Protein of unknown function (DUF3105)